LDIPTKLFSSAPTVSTINARPNTAVHPYDAAVPGFLPSLSTEAVHAALVAAHLLGCKIHTTSRFERKHYSYADLPHAYQITQQRWPIATNGLVETTYTLKGGKKKKALQQHSFSCRISRIQLEQDSGKTVQTLNPSTGYQESRVDLNRAGQALIEIVSEPDLQTPQQAATLVEYLRQLFKHVGICNGRMEEGSLRCDLNVNLQDIHTGERSARVEVKNLNSLRQITDAAIYELRRHANEWPTIEETRNWNVTSSETEVIRRKDQAEDYRFMPEPDLPPLVLSEDLLDGLTLAEFLKHKTPELPEEAISRFIQDYGLNDYQARVIAGDPPAIQFFDTALAFAERELSDPTEQIRKRLVEMTTNFLINDLFGLIKEHSRDEAEASIAKTNVSPEQFGEIMVMMISNKISTTMGKNLLNLLYTTEIDGKPSQVAKDKGWELISDLDELRSIAKRAVLDCPTDKLMQYFKGERGKIKIFKFLTGRAMAESKGNADPERLKEVLQQVLDDYQ
jgi:aspartyl-tRNA(Asn)/glutamyl-tRNA(Gln) amidotransferase subunit B